MSPDARFAVIRILGNELPPRDRPGERLETLRYILEREPRYPGVRRHWILNHMHDPEYAARFKRTLEAAGETFDEIAFAPERYRRLWTRRAKLRYAININGARNFALALGKRTAEFTFVLDGDCFLAPGHWARVEADIAADQAASPDRRYYCIPMARLWLHEASEADLPREAIDEPQLAFRRDSDWIFDERLPFGDRDKKALLERLGHYDAAPGVCRPAGLIAHLNTGSPATELDKIERGRLREQSLAVMLSALDERCGRPRLFFSRRPAAPEPLPSRWAVQTRSFLAGDDLEVVYSPAGPARLLPALLARVLRRCAHFSTLRRHAERMCEGHGWRDRARLSRELDELLRASGRAVRGSLREKAERALTLLADEGMLVSFESLLERCIQRDAAAAGRPAFGAAALVWRGDPERLTRGLASLDESARRLTGRPELVVLDAAGPGGRDERRASLRAASRELGVPARYVGDEEREALVRELESRGAPSDAARFLLLGTAALGAGPGAGRNALLLERIGERVLLCEDEPGCAEPESIAAHEAVLGRRLTSALASLESVDWRIARTADWRLARALEAQAAVAATFQRPLRLDHNGREVDASALDRATLAEDGSEPLELRLRAGFAAMDGRLCSAGTLGLDMSQPLPPFFPVLEHDDALFGSVLAQCGPALLCAQAPSGLLREAPRPFRGDAAERSGLLVFDFLSAWLDQISIPAYGLSAEDRVRYAGARLAELGTLPDRRFEEILREAAWDVARRGCARLGALAAADKSWPYFRRDDLLDEQALLRAEAARPDFTVPRDLAARLGPEAARRAFPALVAEFGRALEGWPALAAAARALKLDRTRLSNDAAR